MYAYCEYDPINGAKLNKPHQYFYDYTRVKIGNKIQVNTRLREGTKDVKTCISCHSRGPILFENNENFVESEETARARKELNDIYKGYTRAIWAHRINDTNNYKDLFSDSVFRNQAGQAGPIKPPNDPSRAELLENCIPKNIDRMRISSISRETVKRRIGEALNCSSCHNIHDVGPINLNLYGSGKANLESRILSSEHPMPPNIHGSDLKEKEKERMKSLLLNCFQLENNPSKSERENTSKKMKESGDFNDDQIEWIQQSRPYFENLPAFSCEEDKTKYSVSKKPMQISPRVQCEEAQSLDPSVQALKLSNLFAFEYSIEPDVIGNNIGYCIPGAAGIFQFPVTVLPSCDTSCMPFSTVMNFDHQGKFTGFSEGENSSPPTKYNHEALSNKEIYALEEWLKYRISPRGSIPEKEAFVDAMSGATKLNLPLSGAGLSMHELLRLGTTFSKMIEKKDVPKKCR